MDLLTAFDEQLAMLRAAGINASADAQDINPPGILLRPPTLAARFGKGWTAEWEAWAIAPDNGTRNAIDTFSTLLQDVQDALGFPIQNARPDSIRMTDNAVLPAFVLTYTTTIATSLKETSHGNE